MSKIRQQVVQGLAAHNEELKKLGDIGRKCLASHDFTEYRRQFQVSRESVVDAMLGLVEPDPLKYAFQMSQYAQTLRDMKLLIDAVEADAQKESK